MSIRALLAAAAFSLVAAFHAPAQAAPPALPAGFKTEMVKVADGEQIFVRTGGTGPAVVLIHGFGDTGEMWSPLARKLARNHLVIVPDLRGMGNSSRATQGYDKKSQATDIRAVLTHYGVDQSVVVGHDIGTMVAYAYAASYPDKVVKLVVMDAPLPGVAPWDQIVLSPGLWHFNFAGKDAERLVAGRERIYLDRFWNEFAGDPTKFDEASRNYYARVYAKPGAMRAAFAQFTSIGAKDVADNRVLSKTKLKMPVLAIGGEKSLGATMAVIMRNAAVNVHELVVPGAGHWLMEEAPRPTVEAILDFIDK